MRMNGSTAVTLAVSIAILAVAPAAAQVSVSAGTPARREATFSGRVAAGEEWRQRFGDGLAVVLAPRPLGWEIVVAQPGRDDNLARLTPPLHGAPNPRDVEGWHFRNSDNTGPNQAGDKNVNAPGEVREFIFSPAVGASIDGPGAGRAPTPEEIEAVRAWGRGTLAIHGYELADLAPGKTARFAWMSFTVQLNWPAPAPAR